MTTQTRKLAYALVLASSIAWNVWSISGAKRNAEAGESIVSAQSAENTFLGNVHLNRYYLKDGEKVVQIVDEDRSVVCYGKLASGGAATISCQKFEHFPKVGKQEGQHGT